MDVLAKPLTWWAVGVGLELLGWSKIKDKAGNRFPMETRLAKAAAAHESIRNLTHEQYLELLDKAYYAHDTAKKDSAKTGTNRHAICATYVAFKMQTPDATFQVDGISPFIDWAEKTVDKWLWSEMNCYSEKHWIGGVSDAGGIDKDGKTFIIDFKSSKEAYMSQFCQIGAYDLQISENGGYTPEGQKVFELRKPVDYYIVFPFGAEKPEPAFYHNPASMREMFLSCLSIYRKLPQQ